jgi:hypothetical protein
MAEVFKLDITKTVKEVAEQALDEYAYKGLTIRQWADKITAGEYQPVKHARWEQCCNLMGEYFKCSECGYKAEVPTCMGEPIYIFCPNCGAKMDGGEKK